MPIRIAAPQPATRARHVMGALVVGIAALAAVQHFMTAPRHRQEASAQAAPAASQGRWTIVFERPESCGEACTRVLETLNAVSHDPASGIPDGDAQVVVRTARGEPARDLIVLDPEGRPAGFISHTTDPGRIVSGLATLRASSASGTPIASR